MFLENDKEHVEKLDKVLSMSENLKKKKIKGLTDSDNQNASKRSISVKNENNEKFRIEEKKENNTESPSLFLKVKIENELISEMSEKKKLQNSQKISIIQKDKLLTIQ